MIVGLKPHAYCVTHGDDGCHRFEGENRQCVHCQYSWIYNPGSGMVRGYCTRHDGWICARPQCYKMQKARLDEMKTGASCVSYYDYNKWRFEQYLKNVKYAVTTGGIFIPVVE